MGKNNNNAGMHFVRHSDYGKYDDLAYYDRNSTEGIANRRYEAIANLEAKGEYLFTRSVSFIQILIRPFKKRHFYLCCLKNLPEQFMKKAE